jgi:hypothetical protein
MRWPASTASGLAAGPMNRRLSTARFAVHPDACSGACGRADAAAAIAHAAANTTRRQLPNCIVIRRLYRVANRL